MTFILSEQATGLYLYQSQSPADLVNSKDAGAANRSVTLVEQHKFATVDEACAYALEVAENKLPAVLAAFLANKVPNGAKLLLAQPQLVPLLTYYQAKHDLAVQRALSCFFPEKELNVQLALAHAYSRSICYFDANLDDQQVIQAIGLYESLTVSANKYYMRLTECFGLHFPELRRLCKDAEQYTVLAAAIRVRSDLADFDPFYERCNDYFKQLGFEDKFDEELARSVFSAARSSTGCVFYDAERDACQLLMQTTLRMLRQKRDITIYLSQKLDQIAPSSQELLGTIQLARLIAKAGGMRNLAKSPASTVQLYGAEKALFRALKKHSKKTPKYGILFNAGPVLAVKNFRSKGRVARTLACAIARSCKIDLYSDVKTPEYGRVMKELIEARVAFYNGDSKRIVKNMDLIKKLYK